ncbi:MAG: clostripain-related cysteine peptidase [Chloroflexota bacterium]
MKWKFSLHPDMVFAVSPAQGSYPEAAHNLRLELKDKMPSFLMSNGNADEKRTVRAGRRRKGTSEPGERERADAPSRQRDDGPRRPTSGGGGSRPSGGATSGGGGGRRPPLTVIIIVILIFVVGSFFFGGEDGGQTPPQNLNEGVNTVPATATSAPAAQVAQNTPTTASQGAAAPATTGDGQTWLIMMYQDADDKVLEEDILIDLNEAERIGSTDRVHIVSQFDRFRSGYSGDGNWDSTKRFYVTQDQDLERVGSQELMDLGEVNMSAGSTLVDFMVWAINAYPADKHVLIMSDHGMGWPGGWSDPSHTGPGDHNVPLAQVLGDELYLMEIDDALGQVRAQTGIEKFELVGMDACLMGHLEVFSALAPHANYAVASQEVEPALGWAYTSFLNDLVRNPDMSGADLGRSIVRTYIQDDQRIVDDQARAKFVGQGSPLSGLFGMLSGPSPEQIQAQLSQNMTLTAVDLNAMPALLTSFNNLTFNLQQVDQRAVAQARNYAQSYTSVFGNNVPPSYIDIGNFAQLLQQSTRDQAVSQAADQVLADIKQAVIAEKHGPKVPGSTGISIYFPNSQLYRSAAAGPQSYTAVARRFANVSLWDDFLTFHYTGRPFQAASADISVPERNATINIPGAGPIAVSPLQVSSNVTSPGNPILLSADIEGDNVGYVKLFVGFYDQAANAIQVTDTDYLESNTAREVSGIFYPDWGAGPFTMEFEWEPIVFAINDGNKSVVAHFTPRTYGASFADATYTVDGIYTYTADQESRYARLLFRDGILRQVFGFTGQNGTGAPREIIPQTGDTFTIIENWLDLDPQGKVVQANAQQGDTLTFGSETFTWVDLDAAAGTYVVGFIVEDLDGQGIEVYQQVQVQ